MFYLCEVSPQTTPRLKLAERIPSGIVHRQTSTVMRILTLPILDKKFISASGKTVIECKAPSGMISVWANGDVTESNALLANIVINEVGDTFIAGKDSKTLDDKGKPVYLKGATVTRQKESTEFKSFAGNGQAAQFAQAANAFGLQLQVVMG